MEVFRSYDQVQLEHPDQVSSIIKVIRKKKGKLRHTDPSTWKWYYLWYEGWPEGSPPDLYWLKKKEVLGLLLVGLCGQSAGWAPLTIIPEVVLQAHIRRNPDFSENP